MKVAGFTFIKNGIKNNYPFRESISSILPLCEKFFVIVGDGEDETLQEINKINHKKIIVKRSKWDEKHFSGGAIFSIETNKSFDLIPDEYDWCFYIQCDECLHEKYLETIQKEMLTNLTNLSVECLVFKYLHFIGSYDYVANSRHWYKNEIRIIRNDKSIRSFKDAQGFRRNRKKLKGKIIDAYIYHYGWVKENLSEYCDKISSHNKHFLNSDATTTNYDFKDVDRIKKFANTHPEVMKKRILEQQKKILFNPKQITNKMKWYKRILQWIEDKTGYRFFEFKNFQSI